MAKREFVMLAHNLKDSTDISGWFASEKHDGMFVFWDGGISRGLSKTVIPWANNDKDERYVVTPIATGLWSRYGNVIHASEEFLDDLPRIPLCGELFLRRGSGGRQEMASICKKHYPDTHEWREVKILVFNLVPLETIFADGVLNNINFKKKLSGITKNWLPKRLSNYELEYMPKASTGFKSTVVLMNKKLNHSESIKVINQIELPYNYQKAHEDIKRYLDIVMDAEGEGLILAHPSLTYSCERTHKLVKVKPTDDMEGKVTGFVAGKGKHEGRMGSLILDIGDGKELEIGGFTDLERVVNEGRLAHGERYRQSTKHFKLGDTVTFRYRGLSNDGIPQEARYWRKHV